MGAVRLLKRQPQRVTGQQVPPSSDRISTSNLDGFATGYHGRTEACVKGWNGIVIRPSSYTLPAGGSAPGSEMASHPALIWVAVPFGATSSTRAVIRLSRPS